MLTIQRHSAEISTEKLSLEMRASDNFWKFLFIQIFYSIFSVHMQRKYSIYYTMWCCESNDGRKKNEAISNKRNEFSIRWHCMRIVRIVCQRQDIFNSILHLDLGKYSGRRKCRWNMMVIFTHVNSWIHRNCCISTLTYGLAHFAFIWIKNCAASGISFATKNNPFVEIQCSWECLGNDNDDG